MAAHCPFYGFGDQRQRAQQITRTSRIRTTIPAEPSHTSMEQLLYSLSPGPSRRCYQASAKRALALPSFCVIGSGLLWIGGIAPSLRAKPDGRPATPLPPLEIWREASVDGLLRFARSYTRLWRRSLLRATAGGLHPSTQRHSSILLEILLGPRWRFVEAGIISLSILEAKISRFLCRQPNTNRTSTNPPSMRPLSMRWK
jgi:hypothetical protein